MKILRLSRLVMLKAMLFLSGAILCQSTSDTLEVRALLNGGIKKIHLGDYPGAEEQFNRAEVLSTKLVGPQHPLTAEALYFLGRCNIYQGKLAVANQYHQQALRARKTHFGDGHHLIAVSLIDLGGIALYSGNFAQAEVYYKDALRILQNSLGENHQITASCRNGLAGLYVYQGQYDLALENYEKILAVLLPVLGEEHPNVAMIYQSLGICEDHSGRYKEAIELYQKSLKARLAYFGENHPDVASTYNSLATAYLYKGDREKAFEFYERSLTIRLKTLGENHPDVATTYGNLGVAYTFTEQHEIAAWVYQKALTVTQKNYGENHHLTAAAYNNLGMAYDDLGDFIQAKYFYQKALDIRLMVFPENHLEVGRSYYNLGNLSNKLGEHDQAIKYLKNNLKIQTNTFGKEHPNIADTYLQLGITYQSKQQFEAAISAFEAAVLATGYQDKETLSSVNSMNQLITTLGATAHYYRELFQANTEPLDLRRSYSFSKDAIAALHHHLNDLSMQSRYDFGSISSIVYEGAMRTNQQLFLATDSIEYLRESFDHLEHTKSLILYQSMQEAAALSYAGIADSILEKENELRIALTKLDKERQKLLSQKLEPTDTAILAISQAQSILRQEHQKLKTKIEEENEDYYRLKYDLSTLDLPSVQRKLLTKDQTLLEYFVGDSSLFAFVVQKENYQVFEWNKDSLLDKKIERLQDGLYSYHSLSPTDQTTDLYKTSLLNYIDAGQDLYNQLIDPIREFLTTKELIIVPDGVLGYIPFGALLSGVPKKVSNFSTYPFFESDFQISYCYSATLLQEMKQKQHQREPDKTLVAFAPFFEGTYETLDTSITISFQELDSGKDTVLIEKQTLRNSFDKLEASGEEVKVASGLWKGDYYINNDATEIRFNEIAKDYRIVHLSTHGIADPRVGDYSYLLFSEIKDSIENEFLYVRDLYNLQLNADLVVLSACETSAGELKRGEGIISLARGFAFAGAKSMITTLWAADDYATKKLMIRLYRGLRKGLTKDAALRVAKLKLLKTNSYAHPFFWANFIAVGDMSPLK